MVSGVLRWENPPGRHGNSRADKWAEYRPAAADLRARPGDWGVVAEGKTPGSASSIAYRIRQGLGPFTPGGSFEARTIGPASGPSTVYARYIGEAGPP